MAYVEYISFAVELLNKCAHVRTNLWPHLKYLTLDSFQIA